MSDIEETFHRIKTHKGVEGILITNSDGICVRTTMNEEKTHSHSGLISMLTAKAKSTIKELDQGNELVFLRIRTKKNEIMVAPDLDYNLIVIQNPEEEQ